MSETDKHRRKSNEPTVTSNNISFIWGMFVGGIAVIVVFLMLTLSEEPAAADEVCTGYAQSSECNELNPPRMLDIPVQPAEDAYNCVQPEELGHCSDLLAATGQSSNIHWVWIGCGLVAAACVIWLVLAWNRFERRNRGDEL